MPNSVGATSEDLTDLGAAHQSHCYFNDHLLRLFYTTCHFQQSPEHLMLARFVLAETTSTGVQ